MVKIHNRTFNQVIQNLAQTGTQQARQLVWDYINAMPTMYFVQCGRQSSPIPWIMFEDDTPVAMIFTHHTQAIQAAQSFMEDDDYVRVVGLPTNAASMYVTALAAQGVEHVCFNHGPQRFDAPMEEVLLALQTMKR